MHLFTIVFCLSMIGLWIGQIVQGKRPVLDIFLDDILRDFVSYEPIFMTARVLTELGSKPFVMPFVIVMAISLLIVFQSILPSLIFAGGTLMTHLINMFIKEIVQRERPSIWIEASAEGYSFPSGHAMISLVCYGLLAYFLSLKVKQPKNKRIVIFIFSTLIILIGMSRFILNVHYTTDILSGFVLGYLLLMSFIHLYWRLQILQSKNKLTNE